ncbi:hypothetical protein JTE90_019209 [Oedothorax gibbosus]|uniref:Uncharacterized protein n=1 Tax=Oedothorax gibbosus TaxID=931172 RepID=A0AAV6THP5_9ARAC|nr:hypothetical protein JTE90_019209 [Oedothorax gibbosus]
MVRLVLRARPRSGPHRFARQKPLGPPTRVSSGPVLSGHSSTLPLGPKKCALKKFPHFHKMESGGSRCGPPPRGKRGSPMRGAHLRAGL